MSARRRRLFFGGTCVVAVAAFALFASSAHLANLLDAPSSVTVRHVAGASSTPVHVSFQYGGETRTYWFYRPQSAQKGAPLIVHLPGSGFPNDGVPPLESLSDQKGLLVAFPEPKSRWSDPAEKPYVGAVIDDVVARYGADPTRVYLTGGSAGGTEAYAVACSPTGAKVAGVGGMFAAIVTPTPGAAGIQSACSPPHPLTIVETHGTADSFVPYNGRACQVSKDSGKTVCLPSQPELMQFWAKVDGCQPTPSSNTDGKLRVDVWQSCRSGTGVQLNSVSGADHSIEAITVNGVSPFARMWSFFSTHPGSLAGLHGSIVRGRVVGHGRQRRLTVVIHVDTPVTAQVTLRRAAVVAASGAFRRPAGTTTLTLPIRFKTRAGTYALTVGLKGAQGQTVLKSAVRVPS